MTKIFDVRLGLMASLTLGLAPFTPPHIIGKVQWVMGGAVGMKPMDWFDLFLHGLPWVYLIISSIVYFKEKQKAKA
ncbi:MAG: hypothetical protein R2799_14870 [Crocinitomicaceae bacterium]